MKTSALFWTSGSNEGLTQKLNSKYSWCSENASIDLAGVKTLLQPAGNAASERCLAYKIDANNLPALVHANCNDENQHLCEVLFILRASPERPKH